MAVVKHYSIKNSPLALLRYITGETKSQKAEIVTGINCSIDPKSAYLEMSLCYETFAGEKFHRTAKPIGKEHIKMHHYVFSFKIPICKQYLKSSKNGNLMTIFK